LINGTAIIMGSLIGVLLRNFSEEMRALPFLCYTVLDSKVCDGGYLFERRWYL